MVNKDLIIACTGRRIKMTGTKREMLDRLKDFEASLVEDIPTSLMENVEMLKSSRSKQIVLYLCWRLYIMIHYD